MMTVRDGPLTLTLIGIQREGSKLRTRFSR
jgi:hypothetical protein